MPGLLWRLKSSSTPQQPCPAHLEGRAELGARVASPQDAQDKPFGQPCPAAASLPGPWSRRSTSTCSVPDSLRGPGDRWWRQTSSGHSCSPSFFVGSTALRKASGCTMLGGK